MISVLRSVAEKKIWESLMYFFLHLVLMCAFGQIMNSEPYCKQDVLADSKSPTINETPNREDEFLDLLCIVRLICTSIGD